MFKAGYYLPPTMTFSEFLGLIEQIVNHLANEYVYRNRCLIGQIVNLPMSTYIETGVYI